MLSDTLLDAVKRDALARELARKSIRATAPRCDPCTITDQDGHIGQCASCGHWYYRSAYGGSWRPIT